MVSPFSMTTFTPGLGEFDSSTRVFHIHDRVWVAPQRWVERESPCDGWHRPCWTDEERAAKPERAPQIGMWVTIDDPDSIYCGQAAIIVKRHPRGWLGSTLSGGYPCAFAACKVMEHDPTRLNQ